MAKRQIMRAWVGCCKGGYGRGSFEGGLLRTRQTTEEETANNCALSLLFLLPFLSYAISLLLKRERTLHSGAFWSLQASFGSLNQPPSHPPHFPPFYARRPVFKTATVCGFSCCRCVGVFVFVWSMCVCVCVDAIWVDTWPKFWSPGAKAGCAKSEIRMQWTRAKATNRKCTTKNVQISV